MNEIKVFTTGGLNYDTELHLLPKDDWIDAMNVRMAASDEQEEGAASNIEGNIRLGNYVLPAGENKCIGAFADEFRNVIYSFICNSNNKDLILEITPETGATVAVFKNIDWTNSVDVTQFQSWIKIPSVDIIHRADDEGDLLFWSDGNSRPRKINIKKAKAYNTADGYPDPISIDYTYVAKKPPLSPTIQGPTFGYYSDFTRTVNNLKNKLFQFQVRFVYDDYEKSTWSGWSDFDIPIRPFEPNRDSDPTINNQISVGIPTGDWEVKKIEIGVRQNIESVWGDCYLIETLDKTDGSIPNNTIYAYPFYNDTVGILQIPAEVNQVWDYVPTKAGSQALANGNTLVYGDITEGIKFDGPLNVILQVDAPVQSLTVGDDFLTWKLHSKYRLGLVYFDEFKRTDGVHTYSNGDGDDTDFDVTMPGYQPNNNFSDTYSILKPLINANIYHIPPIWAKTYKWVRTTHLNYGKFLYYVAFAIDSIDGFNVYFELDPMTTSIVFNGQNALDYDFVPGDRVRVIRRMVTAVPPYVYPSAQMYDVDVQVSAVLKDPIVFTTQLTGTYLKVPKTSAMSSMSPGLYLLELYTPSNNATNTEFFYEFGAEYPILSPGDPDNMRHGGMTADQDRGAGLPARFVFTEGDVYLRPRNVMQYEKGDISVAVIDIPVEDPNYSDKSLSAVNGNGRAYIVDDNQKEQRLPSIIRYGGAYIQDTFINKTNNFPAGNIVDNCDRSFGAIKRLTVRDRQLRVYQELKCGWLPISQNVLQTADGNSIVSQSDLLLNNIQYYAGDFGIGNASCSLATKNFADYFHDTNRGVICRLSRDGLTPISITGKMNRFAVVEDLKYKATVYTGAYPAFASDIPGRAQIFGVFDTKNNTYISAYEEMARYVFTPIPDPTYVRFVTNTPKTLAWDEVRNRFVSSYGYYPEWMVSIKNDVITFKNGVPYIHNDKVNRCRFYEENKDWSLTVVFNDKFTVKKTFETIDEVSNVVIPCPAITSSLVEFDGSTKQESNLVEADFVNLEGHYHAAFLRDENSPGGIIDGDTLKGGYLSVQLKIDEAQSLISLHSVNLGYILSQRNTQ